MKPVHIKLKIESELKDLNTVVAGIEFENDCLKMNFTKDQTEAGLDMTTLGIINGLGFEAKHRRTIGRSKYNKGIPYGEISILY